jgi:LacI family transcriptional regulator/LacI family repressor for deo operon, udp, cdd, tsx, nupC, and nupG
VVTIGDVAAHAGVGAATVSRVLNDSPKVSDPTRARVLAAIELLDYRPSPLARGLSLGRGHGFGVVVPFFTHASAVERLRGVVDVLTDSPYDLVLFDIESPERRDQCFADFLRRDRADGLLVMSLPPAPGALDRLAARGVPVVLVDVSGPNVSSVTTDDFVGGRMATRHLLDLGHQRIGFLGEAPDNPFGFTSSARREAGHLEELATAGVRFDQALIKHGPHERAVAAGLATELLALESRPTAIFASSDVQALGVLEAARAASISVPGELSVIGYDDVELSGYAGLTTVRQPLFESGQLGARMLLDALAGDAPAEPVTHQLPLELVVRSTTGPPPATAQAQAQTQPKPQNRPTRRSNP